MLHTISPPNELVVSLSFTKKYLQVEHDEEDDLIRSMIESATLWAERTLDRSLLRKRYQYDWRRDDTMGYSPKTTVYLLRPPVRALIAIEEGQTHRPIKDYTCYIQGLAPKVILPTCYPHLSITYEAGLADAPEGIPEDLRQAILMVIQTLYAKRYSLDPIADHPALSILRYYKSWRLL